MLNALNHFALRTAGVIGIFSIVLGLVLAGHLIFVGDAFASDPNAGKKDCDTECTQAGEGCVNTKCKCPENKKNCSSLGQSACECKNT